MKILFLDIYKKSNARISKDTAGGYGTENDFGIGIIPFILTRIVKFGLFWPNLMFVQLFHDFKKNKFDVSFLRIHSDQNINIAEYDIIFVCNSIVCFETEINFINNIESNKQVILCGDFFIHSGYILKKNHCVISGNYDYLLSHLKKNSIQLTDLFREKFIHISPDSNWYLEPPDWFREFNKYTKNWLFGYRRYIPFISTRGCPYSCFEYCTYPLSQGRGVFHTEIKQIINSLIIISKKDNNAHIVFRDPVFSINKHFTKELLNSIVESKLKLSYTVELHLKNLDDDMISLMKHANVKVVKFGIESSNESIRSSVNRYSVSNDIQLLNIQKLKKVKIKTVAMYILCQPDDTYETINQTIDYSIKLNTDFAQFSIFTPYPGTPFYNKNTQLIDEKFFENFNQYQLVFKHKIFDKNSAKKILGRAYTKFYLRKFFKIFKINEYFIN